MELYDCSDVNLLLRQPLASFWLLFVGRWIWGSVNMICAVGGDLCYRTRWAARSATLLIVQALQAGDGNFQCIAFLAQPTKYAFQIHSDVSP
jgi:hypothetical protein